jgi:hypothetical protein
MLAIEGPMVSSLLPGGVLACSQRPASRPPGTPPEPARKLVEPAEDTRPQLAIPRLATRATMASPRAAAGRRSRCRGQAPTTSLAASTTATTATGSRYWNPLTGQTWKNRSGTAAQQASSVSRHDQAPTLAPRASSAATSSSGPRAWLTWVR